jgi:hypothetical protein
MNTNLSTVWVIVIIVLALWDLAWRGVGLWKASNNDQKIWYILILVINSLGILPIIYIVLNNKGEDHE